MIRLRGHTLLCLQGFRGEGYSPAFVTNLALIHRDLADHSDQWVEVTDQPDSVCRACPNLGAEGCRLNGDRSEVEMRAQDHDVLSRLGCRPGERYQWSELLERIGRQVTGDDLPAICGSCRWLPLGYCKEGLIQLRRGTAQGGPCSVDSERLKTPPAGKR
jgi:hypothetical protein